MKKHLYFLLFLNQTHAHNIVGPVLEFVIRELANGLVALRRRQLLERLRAVLEFGLRNVSVQPVFVQIVFDAIQCGIHAHVRSPVIG